MKLNNILFNRYLFRQRLIMICVALIVCAITTITLLLTLRTENGVLGILLLIVVIAIWFFPLYLIIVTTITYLTLQKEMKNIGEEKELFDRMTNELIRELVVRNGVKVSVLIEKKTDLEKFNKVIDEELKFQRKKIELLNSNNL
ncbi:MAG: hypothetical protein ACRC63_03425 [Metamycoplasmataceae bacterium]